MNYLPISDNAARQIIDASSIWTEYLKALASAKPYAGGMSLMATSNSPTYGQSNSPRQDS